jgi:CarD family transcriptional regulator
MHGFATRAAVVARGEFTMAARTKVKKTKVKKARTTAGAKPAAKRSPKSTSTATARNRISKSKSASSARAARKAVQEKAKSHRAKPSKRNRRASDASAKKRVTAAARKAAASKTVRKTKSVGGVGTAKEKTAAQTLSKEMEAKLRSKESRNASDLHVGTEKAAAAAKPPVADRARTTDVGESAPPVKGAAAAPKASKAAPAEEAGAAKPAKAPGGRQSFKLHEHVVYPAHGVGQIVAIEEQEVAGFKLELFVISFSKDKLTLRVPTSKVAGVGMRKISDTDTAKRSLEILTGRARIKRTMWSRRAQEYETKINSGDINAIAEVVRDLYRSEAQPEQSYSERQLYEAALDRMVREIAAVQKSNEIDALKTVEAQLQKGQSRAAKAAAAQTPAAEIEQAA